ncbi:MAG: hypothetical protein HYV45_02550, partial [Candidatus Moranbacteria bacterium]|nr:hypothetical protein [Candidatus Moranbacteria bacterium]
LDGETEGSFTLEIKETEGDTTIAEATFAAIPSTADTQVIMDFPDGTIEHAEPLIIDYDGNGETDLSLEPKIGEVVTTEQLDTIPPTTTLSFSGTQGANDWYTSDGIVTFTATDNENGSGIDKTEYSFDNGTTWNLYTDLFTISTEGETILQYRSTDKANNQEETKTENIKIDKTAPEAKISFNKETQKLDISGTDNLSDTSVTILEKQELISTSKKTKKIKDWFPHWYKKHKKNLPDSLAIITDQAGHTTSLSFEKTKDRDGFIFVRLLSIGYDGEETTLKDTETQYQWKIDKQENYRFFASSLKAGETRLESRYFSKKDETRIMEKPKYLKEDNDEENDSEDNDKRPSKTKLPGMVIPYLESEKGEIGIKY